MFYRKALDLAERLASTDAKNATARIELARSIGKWADVIEEIRPADALAQYTRALEIAESVLPDGPDRQALRGYAYLSIGSAAARLAAIVPKDFGVAFRQVNAIEGLTKALVSVGAADEVTALRRRLVELWTKWDGLQPGSSFIQLRLREATNALAR